jgi:hypothetical protein
MRPAKKIALFTIVITLLVSSRQASAQETQQTVETRIGKLDFEHGVPTQATVKNLYDQMDFQRACQLYLWALPAVGFEQLQATLEGTTGALPNDVAIFKGYGNLLVFFTPNATTPYTLGFLDLAKAGPVVMDVPVGPIAGSAMDFWQRPLSDLGLAGPDQGKGGKYVFVGPGQEAPTVPRGIVLRSPTFRVVFFYRALDPDPAKAETLSKGVSIYPWAERDHPPATRFLTPDPDKIAKFIDPPRGMEYWERLAAFIQREPVEDRDRFFMAMLRPLGIEKGRPFKPDERQKKILTEGAFVGEAMAKADSFDMRVPDALCRPDALWLHFMMLDPMQDLANYSELDERAAYFYSALGVTKGMLSKTPGVGQAYLGSFRDKEGHAFDGAQSYHLHVPPNPPAKQFWSVTLYDVDTRSLIQNKEERSDRSSRQDLVKNADGSVDLYFAPTPPHGFEKNWIPTVPGKAWFAVFRFYAPLEPYFDKSWPLPDMEKVK